MNVSASLWPWLFLALAVVVAFLQRPRAAFILVMITLAGARVHHFIQLPALVFTLAGLILACLTRVVPIRYRWIAHGVLLIWSVALLTHAVPGFDNPRVLNQVVAGPHSAPFNLYLNLDKPMVFFALLFAFPAITGKSQPWRPRLLAVTALVMFSLLPLAWALGALRPEVTLPDWWWLFALNNLILTCVAEEAFFRGYIQQGLASRFNHWVALIAAMLLFGLAHFAGGILLMLFAGLAGLCYGLAFLLSGRLWVAILFHFLFNMAHLVFFTYPVLAR